MSESESESVPAPASAPENQQEADNTEQKAHNPPQVDECLERLETFISEERKGLKNKFFANKDLKVELRPYAERASILAEKLLAKGCSREIAKELAVLTLYDLALLIDDSDSMEREEEGQRKKTLEDVLTIISDIFSLAAEEGKGILSVRFINDSKNHKNIKPEDVGNLVKNHRFRGVTRIGTALQKKILQKLVFKSEGTMEKPLLVMIITDGKVEGEKQNVLEKVILDCVSKLIQDEKRTPQSVAFQFSRIGNDKDAEKLLHDLDDHKQVGRYVNCQRATQGFENQEKWLVVPQLLLGAIIPDWDRRDDEEDQGDGPDADFKDEDAGSDSD